MSGNLRQTLQQTILNMNQQQCPMYVGNAGSSNSIGNNSSLSMANNAGTSNTQCSKQALQQMVRMKIQI